MILRSYDQKIAKIPFYLSGVCVIAKRTDMVKLSGFDGELFLVISISVGD